MIFQSACRSAIGRGLLALAAGLLATSCATQRVEDYRAERPVLDLRQYFAGPVEAWGMFQDRDGKVLKRFKVDIASRTEGDQLVLEESFRYQDGTRQQRVWRLTPAGDGRWRGTAGDVVGEAAGVQSGNALQWRYTLMLPVDGETYAVDFDDWMYLIDPQVMVNRSSMRKFGVELGQVTLFFRKAG
ncbi:DUF3833 domain-containing protein [Chitinimonas koreensis]|nr:DUF3833 domain-containing protein [Chitinimonas koreensis]